MCGGRALDPKPDPWILQNISIKDCNPWIEDPRLRDLRDFFCFGVCFIPFMKWDISIFPKLGARSLCFWVLQSRMRISSIARALVHQVSVHRRLIPGEMN
jgi:hypothetical protein